MRVDYTLPAIQPQVSPDVAGPSSPDISGPALETPPSFRDRLRSVSIPLPGAWEQQLRLDARPFTASYIGPPPRPRTLEMSDAETERARWRNMLWRHDAPPDALPVAGGNHQAIGNMMTMLLQMQDMEDSIVSQSVALTRG
ncbi:MAG TPA: hypothetical protein VJQ82_10430 [Terriglobales bacterium]|nr:hypothetical protein [Terriglobales bacterium]